MRALALRAESECRVYFTGGATAVLEGWREETIDADILIVPESDSLLRALPELKESLYLNVELASPAHFIPELPGWADRSRFIERHGNVSFHHYDFYAQALAKIERGEVKDLADVSEMIRRGLVEPGVGAVPPDRAEPLSLSRHRRPRVPPRGGRGPGTGAQGSRKLAMKRQPRERTSEAHEPIADEGPRPGCPGRGHARRHGRGW